MIVEPHIMTMIVIALIAASIVLTSLVYEFILRKRNPWVVLEAWIEGGVIKELNILGVTSDESKAFTSMSESMTDGVRNRFTSDDIVSKESGDCEDGTFYYSHYTGEKDSKEKELTYFVVKAENLP